MTKIQISSKHNLHLFNIKPIYIFRFIGYFPQFNNTSHEAERKFQLRSDLPEIFDSLGHLSFINEDPQPQLP